MVRCYFEGGYQDTSVYLLDRLSCDHVLPGPAIIIDKNSTIVIEPGCEGSITDKGENVNKI